MRGWERREAANRSCQRQVVVSSLYHHHIIIIIITNENCERLPMEVVNSKLQSYHHKLLHHSPTARQRWLAFKYSASKTLDDLISEKKNGTFDFAFIDADKSNYDTYYEKCLVLMKRGGVIAFDNTLWSGKVLSDSGDTTEDTQALRKLNHKLANDVARVHVVQLNVGDGYTMAVKI